MQLLAMVLTAVVNELDDCDLSESRILLERRIVRRSFGNGCDSVWVCDSSMSVLWYCCRFLEVSGCRPARYGFASTIQPLSTTTAGLTGAKGGVTKSGLFSMATTDKREAAK